MNLLISLARHKISQYELAEYLGVTQGAVNQWGKRGVVPAKHCPRIEELFNGEILCEEMNNQIDWGYLRSAKSRQSYPKLKLTMAKRLPPRVDDLPKSDVSELA